MKQGENGAGKQRDLSVVVDRGEEAIGDERVQPDLLHQTKGHVSEKVPGNQERLKRALPSSEKNPNDYEPDETRHKNHHRILEGAREIICAPSEGFERVFVE
jgi:hypothetical protein